MLKIQATPIEYRLFFESAIFAARFGQRNGFRNHGVTASAVQSRFAIQQKTLSSQFIVFVASWRQLGRLENFTRRIFA